MYIDAIQLAKQGEFESRLKIELNKAKKHGIGHNAHRHHFDKE